VSKVVLDTDILSEILKKKDARVADRGASYRDLHGRFTITVVSVLEIVRGLRRAGAIGKLQAFIASLAMQEVLTLDAQAAVLAGEIDASLTLAGRPIGVADVMVAAIALHHGLTLVSGNETHYQAIREAGYPLVIENWRRAQ
jgi:tRNA(fMet)-specific endonuclease VapC